MHANKTPQTRNHQGPHHIKMSSFAEGSGQKTLQPLDSYKLITRSRNKMLLSSTFSKIASLRASQACDGEKIGDHSHKASDIKTGDTQSFVTPRKALRGQMGKTLSYLSAPSVSHPQVILKLSKDNVYHIYCRPSQFSKAEFTSVSHRNRGKPGSIEIGNRFEPVESRYVATDMDRHIINSHYLGCNDSDVTEKQQIITELSDYSLDQPQKQDSPETLHHDTERLNIDQINDGITYINGGIGVKKRTSVRKGNLPRRSLKTGELSTLHEEVTTRRSRMGTLFSSLGNSADFKKCFATSKMEYWELIKEEDDELELTPADNIRFHTVKSEYRPSTQNRFRAIYGKHKKTMSSTLELEDVKLDQMKYPPIDMKNMELCQKVDFLE